MNPCRNQREKVTLLACGALDSAAANRTRQHVQDCVACREYLREMSAVVAAQVAAARNLPDATVSPCVFRRVTEAIKAKSHPSRQDPTGIPTARWWPLAGLVTIAMGIAVAVGWIPWHRIPDPVAVAITSPSVSPAPPSLRLSSAPENSNLIGYRLALNRSPEAFDNRLEIEAVRPSEEPILPVRSRSRWVDFGL